jgi:glycosyltransferase involved in cell wall biosynthesis
MVTLLKNVCLLTTKYPADAASPWLTNELAYSLKKAGKNVTVIALSWMRDDPVSSCSIENGIKVVRIKLPALFYKRLFIMTALKILAFPLFVRAHVRKNVEACDLLIGNTPCVTIFGLTQFFKRRFSAKSFLVLWDFFPYYLKDLGVVRNNATFSVLRWLERFMYESFDKIGCMTNRNIDFLLDKYSYSSPSKPIQLPIWAAIKQAPAVDKQAIKKKHGLPIDKVIAVYGGAMSIVQDLTNLLSLAESARKLNVCFVLIGSGTEKESLIEDAKRRELENVIFLNSVSRSEYEELLCACDIGLIFLSHRLTVPSFPSKSLDYFKLSLPILAGLDAFTDFGETLVNVARAGFYAKADQTEELVKMLEQLVEDPSLRAQLGANGRKYYEVEFDVDRVRDKILSVIS